MSESLARSLVVAVIAFVFLCVVVRREPEPRATGPADVRVVGTTAREAPAVTEEPKGD